MISERGFEIISAISFSIFTGMLQRPLALLSSRDLMIFFISCSVVGEMNIEFGFGFLR